MRMIRSAFAIFLLLVFSAAEAQIAPSGGGGSGTVTSIATGCQAAGGTITTTGTISTAELINDLTGSNPLIAASTCGSLVLLDNSGAQTPTIAEAGTSGWTTGVFADLQNPNTGTQALTPSAGTINGTASYALVAGAAVRIISDGISNYRVVPYGGGGTPTLPLTVAGTVTSGGVPYFNSTTQESSSALLAANDIIVGGGAGTAPATDAHATISAGALSLGASGTAGSVAFGNGTSGVVTLQPVTGALGTVTASLPANSGTLAELNFAQTWSAVQSIDSGDLALLGSSSGTTTLNANSASGTVTATLPANTGIIAELNYAQTWSAVQTVNNADLSLAGSSSGNTLLEATAAAGSGTVATFPANTGILAELNYAQTWSAAQTFGEVLGTVTTQSGATYTFAATDCGTEVTFSDSSAITATIPETLPAGCNIAVAQIGTAKVSVNGSAVAAATLHSAHSYTGTSAQYAVIGINIEANSGGSAAIALLTGDGS